MRLEPLLLLALCFAIPGFAQRPNPAVPDNIFYNGKVITVDRDFHIAQAFAVKGETFLAVGSNREMRALAGPKTRLIDLTGHAVIPGLMDNHNHQHMAAMLDRGVDMSNLTSLAE